MRSIFALRILVLLLMSVVTMEASDLWYETYEKGLNAVSAGDWTMAEEQFQLSILQGPKSRGKVRAATNYVVFMPEYHLGVVFFRQGKYSKALNQFGLVESSGLVTSGMPEYAEMSDLIRQAQQKIQQSTTNSDVAGLLESAKSLLDQQRFSEARQPLEEARKKDPANPQIPYLFSLIYKRENEKRTREEALKLIQSAKSSIKQKDWAAARVILEEAAGMDPQNPEIRRLLEETRQKELPLPPPPPLPEPEVTEPAPPPVVGTSKEKQGIRAFYHGEYQNAISLLLLAQQESAGSAKLHFYLGCSYAGFALKTGNNKEALLRKARENFMKSWKLDPSFKYHNKYISPQIADIYLGARRK